MLEIIAIQIAEYVGRKVFRTGVDLLLGRATSALLRLPSLRKRWKISKKKICNEKLIADPFDESVPKYICEEGDEFIQKQHIKKTEYLDLTKRNALKRHMGRMRGQVEWFDLRSTRLVIVDDSKLQETFLRFSNISRKNVLIINNLWPKSIGSLEGAYKRNVENETFFLLSDIGRINKDNLRLSGGILLDELLYLFRFKKELTKKSNVRMADLYETIYPFDYLTRMLFCLLELNSIAKIAKAAKGSIILRYIDNAITYRGFYSLKNFATLKVGLLDKPWFIQSHLSTRDNGYMQSIDKEYKNIRNSKSIEFNGYKEIIQAQDMISNNICASISKTSFADQSLFPTPSMRGQLVEKIRTEQQNRKNRNLGLWFRENIQETIKQMAIQQLHQNQLINQ